MLTINDGVITHATPEDRRILVDLRARLGPNRRMRVIRGIQESPGDAGARITRARDHFEVLRRYERGKHSAQDLQRDLECLLGPQSVWVVQRAKHTRHGGYRFAVRFNAPELMYEFIVHAVSPRDMWARVRNNGKAVA